MGFGLDDLPTTWADLQNGDAVYTGMHSATRYTCWDLKHCVEDTMNHVNWSDCVTSKNETTADNNDGHGETWVWMKLAGLLLSD
jgi:hypothetical protein